MNQVLRWGFTPSDLIELIEEAEMTLKELARVPLPTRKLFRIILTRSHKYTYGGQYTDREVSIPELQQATNLSDSDFGGCISILDKAGFIHDIGTNDFGAPLIGIKKTKSSWPIWSDLLIFYDKERLSIASAIENLDFSGMD